MTRISLKLKSSRKALLLSIKDELAKKGLNFSLEAQQLPFDWVSQLDDIARSINYNASKTSYHTRPFAFFEYLKRIHE